MCTRMDDVEFERKELFLLEVDRLQCIAESEVCMPEVIERSLKEKRT